MWRPDLEKGFFRQNLQMQKIEAVIPKHSVGQGSVTCQDAFFKSTDLGMKQETELVTPESLFY